jgi:hypothetical protein
MAVQYGLAVFDLVVTDEVIRVELMSMPATAMR